MKKFTKIEIGILLIIFGVLFTVTFFNMSVSLRRGRDAIRKDDLSALQKALDTYYQKYRVYPRSSEDGRVIGCFNEDPVFDKLTGEPINAVICNWGESYFESDNLMPRDPQYKSGASYLYKSDTKSYELFIGLEGKDEAEFTESIESKYLHCGTKICNYGRGG